MIRVYLLILAINKITNNRIYKEFCLSYIYHETFKMNIIKTIFSKLYIIFLIKMEFIDINNLYICLILFLKGKKKINNKL